MSEPTGGLATFGIDGRILLAQLINFLVVLFVLKRFAWGPIAARLDARSKKIEEGMKDAEEAAKRLKSADAERASMLSATRSEASAIVEKARADSEAMRAELIARAKGDVERVVMGGKAQLKAEQEAMKAELKRDVAEFAVEAARRILAEGVSKESSERLSSEMVVAWARKEV
ncbi:ATP synthase F0 subunit B [Patescibacteria group bacterium]|nr:MAG: ATP synthase F0 subunit B [Patescibacteria group bacterium]